MLYMLFFLLSLNPANSSLSPSDEIVRAYKNTNKYLSIQEDLNRAKAEKALSGSRIYPRLELVSSANRLHSKDEMGLQQRSNANSTYLNFNLPLFKSGGIYHGLKKADYDFKIATLNTFKLHQDNLRALISLFSDALISLKKREALKESEKIQQEFLRVTERKARQGNARPFELSQARAEYLSFQSRLKNLENEINIAIESLNKELEITNLEDLSQIDFIQDIKANVKNLLNIPLAHYTEIAIQQRPEIEIQKIELNRNQSQYRLDMSDELPSLDFNASYGYQNTIKQSLFDDNNLFHTFGLSLSIPIFSGLSSKYKRRLNSARELSIENLYRSTIVDIETQVLSAYENLKTNMEVLNATKSWASEAQKAYQQAKRSFDVGSIDTAQLLQIQQGKERAETQLAEDQMDLFKKYIEFKYSIEQVYFKRAKPKGIAYLLAF